MRPDPAERATLLRLLIAPNRGAGLGRRRSRSLGRA